MVKLTFLNLLLACEVYVGRDDPQKIVFGVGTVVILMAEVNEVFEVSDSHPTLLSSEPRLNMRDGTIGNIDAFYSGILCEKVRRDSDEALLSKLPEFITLHFIFELYFSDSSPILSLLFLQLINQYLVVIRKLLHPNDHRSVVSFLHSPKIFAEAVFVVQVLIEDWV